MLPKRRRRQTGFRSVAEPIAVATLLMRFTKNNFRSNYFNCQIKNVLHVLKVKITTDNCTVQHGTILIKRNMIGKWSKKNNNPLRILEVEFTSRQLYLDD